MIALIEDPEMDDDGVASIMTGLRPAGSSLGFRDTDATCAWFSYACAGRPEQRRGTGPRSKVTEIPYQQELPAPVKIAEPRSVRSRIISDRDESDRNGCGS